MAVISLTLRDAFARETHKAIECKAQIDLATYDALVTAVVAAIDDITDLAVVRADLILKNILELPGTPAAGANVDVGATFSGELAGEANRKASHKMPGFDITKVEPDGTIDLADVDVKAYLDMFLDAGQLLLSDGETMGEWLKGSLDR